MTITPAETFPPGQFLQEELDARGWSTMDLVRRMPGDPTLNYMSVSLLLAVRDRRMLVDADDSARLGAALGVSPAFFANLDRAWRESAPANLP